MAGERNNERGRRKNSGRRSGSRKSWESGNAEHGEFKIYDLNADKGNTWEKRRHETSSINTGEAIKIEALSEARENSRQKESIEPISVAPHLGRAKPKKDGREAKLRKSDPEQKPGRPDAEPMPQKAEEPIEDIIGRKLVEQVEHVAAEEPVKEAKPVNNSIAPEYGSHAERTAGPETAYFAGGRAGSARNADYRTEKRRKGRAPDMQRILFRAAKTVIILAVVVWMGYRLLPGYCVKREMTVEAGSNCPEVSSFLNWKNTKARFSSGTDENTVFQSPGDYGVMIHVYGRDVASIVHVKDTTPKEVASKNNSVIVLEVKKTFQKACFEAQDQEPPVIEGVKEITITEGSSVSYKKGITVTDNVDSNVELIVDTGDADTNKAGDYPITYRAVDTAGNEAVEKTTLHVKPRSNDSDEVTEATVNAAADDLLSRITDDSMTQYEKAEAIYWWCHENIAYSDNTPKVDWVDGAYRGIVKRRGDCYTYAATAKCLLTRAGITNFDIQRIQVGNSMHYWNVIDIGEGWHHFDTCRRKDGSTFFYKTDAELMEYSDSHNGTHNYDRSLYPVIP